MRFLWKARLDVLALGLVRVPALLYGHSGLMAIILPTVHPAAVLRGGRPISDVIAADLGKAWRISQSGIQLDESILWILPGVPIGIEEAYRRGLAWLQHWQRIGARVGVDVETSALDYYNCKLYSIAIAEAEASVAVSFTLLDLHTLPEVFEQPLVIALRALLADEGVEKVFHNAPFDMSVLHRKGLSVRGPILDTQGLHHLVQPDIPHDLGWVGHTYLDVEPWKLDHESGKMANTNNPVELLIYNAKDALYTAKLVEPLMRDITARGMSPELARWQASFAQLAVDMELAGIPVNLEKRRQMAVGLRDKMQKTLAVMREYLGWNDFNPMSTRHREEALFSPRYAGAPWNLGLTPGRKTKKTQQPSTSYKSVIDSLEHPFVRALATYVESRQTYAIQYKDGTLSNVEGTERETPGAYQQQIYPDGRLHPRWKPNTLASSRFGSEANVQNQRLADREFFEAPEGRVFVAADKDQLELRIVACRSGCSELLEEMGRPGGDPHRLGAKHVYGDAFLSRNETEQKLLRNMVKNVTYASLYMAGVETVWRTIRERKQLDPALRAAMTLAVVRHIHTSYFMRFMEIPRFNEATVRIATQQGYLSIPPLGRRRYFPVKPIPATEAVNWQTQCLGADVVTMEMVLMQDELRRKYHGRAFMILHGHDQAVCECDERDAEDVKKLFQRVFCKTPLEGPAGVCYLTAKPSIGKNLMQVK